MKKRKFFSFMLMGLLTLGATSMVTSCKDYDDDINNLQDEQAQLTSQINTLQSTLSSVQSAAASHATKTELEAVQSQVTTQGTQLNSLASQVTTAISNAESAQTAATAAQNAVETLKAQIPDVSGFATKDEIANFVTSTVLDERLEALKTEIQNANAVQLQQIKDEVAKYSNAIDTLYTAVTSVELVGSFTNNNLLKRPTTSEPIALDFMTGTVAPAVSGNTFTFGVKELDAKGNAYSGTPQGGVYTKGSQISSSTSFVIRVSPTNANLDASMIKIINSKGESLTDNILTVDSVVAYDNDILTTRASSKSGLYKVYVELQPNVTPKGTNKLSLDETEKGGKDILFAVAVNNTAAKDTTAAAADRYVVSSYDLTANKTHAYHAPHNLGRVQVYAETGSNTKYDISQLKGDGGDGVTPRGTNVVDVVNGQYFDVDVTNLMGQYSGVTGEAATQHDAIEYFYVVRDDGYASDDNASANSEINAWRSYQYEGLNTIIPVDKATGKGVARIKVTIPTNLTIPDQVGFRIFAVDAEGKLIPPYTKNSVGGESFRVNVTSDKNQTAVSDTILATKAAAGALTTKVLALNPALKAGTALSTTNLKGLTVKSSTGKEIALTATFYEKKNNDGTGNSATTDASKAKYVQFTVSNAIKDWADDETLTFNIYTETAGGLKDNEIVATLTKKLPTAEETKTDLGFAWRPNQFDEANRQYTAFMSPATNWQTASATGSNNFINAVRFTEGKNVSGLILRIANADKYKDGNSWKSQGIETDVTSGTFHEVASSNTVNIPVTVDTKNANDGTNTDGTDWIDGKTTHASQFAFNYGAVTSKSANDVKDDDNYAVVTSGTGASATTTVNYTPVFETFNTVFDCPWNYNTYTWNQRNVGSDATNGHLTSSHASWADVNAVQYSQSGTVLPTDLLEYVKVTNTSRNEDFIRATALQGYTTPATTVTGMLTNLVGDWTPKFVTAVNGQPGTNQDYYTASKNSSGAIVLTASSAGTNVTAPVASFLVISGTDAFGHDVTINLPFTLNPASAAKKK